MDLVRVTCYGKTEELTRNEATEKYLEAMLWSEGSESERYSIILGGLLSGLSDVSDEL